MEREDKKLTFKHRDFKYTKYTFSIDEDRDLMKLFQEQGENLKKKLNPALARDASIIRDFKTKEIDAIGGIISEYLWQHELEIAIIQNNLNITLFNPRLIDPSNQIDVQISYNNKISKTIEVRSSYAYTGEENGIRRFHIIGWYKTGVKKKEFRKDFYVFCIFPFDKKYLKAKLNDNLSVCLTGGLSSEEFEIHPEAYYKNLEPMNELFDDNSIPGSYRIIPIKYAKDTPQILKEILHLDS